MKTALKRFEEPDEVRTFERGKFEIVRMGGMTIGRPTYQPGSKWSKHVWPTVGAVQSGQDSWVVGKRAAGLATLPRRRTLCEQTALVGSSLV
jgi:hypothetical protein